MRVDTDDHDAGMAAHKHAIDSLDNVIDTDIQTLSDDPDEVSDRIAHLAGETVLYATVKFGDENDQALADYLTTHGLLIADTEMQTYDTDTLPATVLFKIVDTTA